MARNIYGNVLNTASQIAQQYNPNMQVSTPVVPPVQQQQSVEQPAAPPTPANIVKRNFFRVDPTVQQAQVVEASPISEQQRAQQVQQMQIDAARNQAAQEAQVAQGNNSQQAQIASMDDLARAMGYTSPQEEEKIRRASLTNQKIMAVTDALRHIGNIANTVHYAPAQQFNNPVLEEEARYQKGKALRDKANYTYLNYQQKKAIQDAKAKQWEEEREYKNRMLDHYRDQDRRLWRQQDETARRNAVLEDLKRQEFEARKAYNEGRISIAEFNARTSRIRALRTGLSSSRGGKGMDEYTVTTNTTYNYDENGKKTGSTTTKERTVNGKKQPKQTAKKQNPMGGSGSGKKKNPMS